MSIYNVNTDLNIRIKYSHRYSPNRLKTGFQFKLMFKGIATLKNNNSLKNTVFPLYLDVLN